jgi:hypothetical protein
LSKLEIFLKLRHFFNKLRFLNFESNFSSARQT